MLKELYFKPVSDGESERELFESKCIGNTYELPQTAILQPRLAPDAPIDENFTKDVRAGFTSCRLAWTR
jgi:hypothetical protein